MDRSWIRCSLESFLEHSRSKWDFVEFMKVTIKLSVSVRAKESVAVQLVTNGSPPADLDEGTGVCIV